MATKKREERPARKSRLSKEGTKEKVAKKKKAKSSDAETKREPKQKKGKKQSETEAEVEESAAKAAGFNPLAGIDITLDSIERHYGLTGGVDPDEKRTSTGMLAYDLILGRGLVPGWYTVYGPEQSCKSTAVTTLIGAAMKTNVPIISLFDYEGSQRPDYSVNIFNTLGFNTDLKGIFGVQGEDGSWIVRPRVRYYAEGVAEKFFDYLAQLERRLPDKRCIKGEWCYIYAGKTAEGKIHRENQKLTAGHYDEKYFKKTGNFKVPAPDGSLQALLITDSYPAMLPEKQDVDDPNSAIAVQARMFSDQLKRVKGKLKAKRICVLGVNQLRAAPMAMFSSPEVEPGGQALKFYSDVRLRQYPRSLSAVPGNPKGKGMLEKEPSVQMEGNDHYRYINVRAIKNKLSVPGLECWLRLWIKSPDGVAHGFDPVYDCWYYLKVTGQAQGKRSAIKLNLGGDEAKKALSWTEFKILVLGGKKEQAPIWEHLKLKPRDLRAWCSKQLSQGDGMDRFLAQQRADEAGEKDDED